MAANTSEDGPADDSSQWTRIVRKGKKLSRQRQAPHPPSQPPAAGPAENFQPNASPHLSLNDIAADHEKTTSRWRGTDCYKKLHEIIKKNAASHAAITNAVCLGLGAFDPDDGSWLAQRRSHIQLAAFLTMVEALGNGSRTRIVQVMISLTVSWQKSMPTETSNATTRNLASPSQTRTSSPASVGRLSSLLTPTNSSTRLPWSLESTCTGISGLPR